MVSCQITTAQQMMEKAKVILARAEPAHAEGTTRLTELTDQSVLLVKEEAAKATELEEAQARLAQTLTFAEDGLRKQALAAVKIEREEIICFGAQAQILCN